MKFDLTRVCFSRFKWAGRGIVSLTNLAKENQEPAKPLSTSFKGTPAFLKKENGLM